MELLISVSRTRVFLLAFQTLVLAGASARADPYDRIAHDLDRAAVRHEKKRVAILPFQAVPDRQSNSGLIVSERLMGRVASRGHVEVVERTLLESVLQEAKLALSGALRPGSLKGLGQVLGVDAIVTGTVLGLNDGRLEVNARMIDAESAKVLSVSAARVEKDWGDVPFEDFKPWNVSAPPLPQFETGPSATVALWRDSLNDSERDCGRAAESLGALDQSLIELKARYWSLRLRDKDFSNARLTRNPGSEIRDPETRRLFYGRLRSWHAQPTVPALSREEMRMLSDYADKSRLFDESCRGQL